MRLDFLSAVTPNRSLLNHSVYVVGKSIGSLGVYPVTRTESTAATSPSRPCMVEAGRKANMQAIISTLNTCLSIAEKCGESSAEEQRGFGPSGPNATETF
jgi:hypothetical protein